MLDKVKSLFSEIKDTSAKTEEEIEQFRLKFIGRNNVINELFGEFKSVPSDQKRELGPALNELKVLAATKLKELSASLNSKEVSSADVDVTLPGIYAMEGSIHPISQTRSRIIEIFERQGFNVEDGPEIDNDWNNFTALNFPKNHPAREMQDTYFIEKDPDILLRTHTSNVQTRLMKAKKPPIRSIMPGRVYRNEAISARAHCFFHQVEGLVVGENISFKDLKNTLYHFSKEMFGKDTKIRLRPSYFPFTEPSAEIDISCFICGGSGCKICKQTGWVEIAGSGMVDPNVLENCGIDSTKYSGFAFGMGIERVTMLKYQLDDLRLFSENDIRFLKQF
ncbi:phenylalanine--tRNA ligase subunit alpha [Ekhidna sp.]|uniref:phenylalanine--tRNA ligase subunit alpha n=1 Tax=Ekhidna sp. TaxID=2608089 RepID=UPI003BACCEAA